MRSGFQQSPKIGFAIVAASSNRQKLVSRSQRLPAIAKNWFRGRSGFQQSPKIGFAVVVTEYQTKKTSFVIF